MTVTVKQLIRGAGLAAPPPRPPVPTMRFVQQPTDTVSGQLFNPVVTVEVSDGAPNGDQLRISSTMCAIDPVIAVTQGGLATFTGLRAGPANHDCRLHVENLSRPQIADIFSDPFDVSPAPATKWTLIAAGATTPSSPFFASVVLHTTGANVILGAIASSLDADIEAADSFFNAYDLTFQQFGVFAPPRISLLWAYDPVNITNPVTGPFHEITFASAGPAYMAAVVFAFRAEDNYSSALYGDQYGASSGFEEVTAIGPYAQMPLSGQDSLIFSGLAGRITSATMPAGFQGYTISPDTVGLSYGCAGAFDIRFNTGPVLVNPIWVVPSPSILQTALLGVEGNV